MGESHSEKKVSDAPEWPLVSGQRQIVEELWSASKISQVSGHSPLFPLLDAVQDSTATLLDLARGGRKVRDAFVVARVVYETAVNAAFILASGPEVAERAWRYAKQKSIRDLERRVEIADETIHIVSSAAQAALADPANQALLDEFTYKSGREVASWTPENVRERVGRILQEYGRDTTIGMMYGLLLYRHASEIAHGSLFGALYSYGATDPRGHPKSLADLAEFRYDQMRLILMLTGFTLNSLVRVVGAALAEPELVARSNEVDRAFRKRPRNGSDA